MNKKVSIFTLLICIILITSSAFASSEKIYKLKIEKNNTSLLSSSYFTYYIYENELNKLNSNEENIIVYSSLEDLRENKEAIIKVNNENPIEYKLIANDLDELNEENKKLPWYLFENIFLLFFIPYLVFCIYLIVMRSAN